MIKISATVHLNESELVITSIRASGPGGQNVNKVATAIQLRFNVLKSPSLPEAIRQRLIKLTQSQLTHEGDFIIKANRFRTQEQNKRDALNRLITLIRRALIPKKIRKKTKPTRSSVEKRLESKKHHSQKKNLRSQKEQ